MLSNIYKKVITVKLLQIETHVLHTLYQNYNPKHLYIANLKKSFQNKFMLFFKLNFISLFYLQHFLLYFNYLYNRF